MRSDDFLNLVATKFSVGYQHSIARAWLIGNLWWWMEPQDSKDIFTQISTSISFAWAPTHTHNANVRSIKRSISSLPSANAHNDAAGSWLPDNPLPGEGWGYVHDTCKEWEREREKARKNLVLVYLIFTFQLFFGPCPAPLSRLGSSHNFFRFPFCFLPPIASAFLSQFSFCKSSVPFACLLWLWSSSFWRLLLPVFTSFLPCLLWNFHKVFVLLKIEYIINRIWRECEGALDILTA